MKKLTSLLTIVLFLSGCSPRVRMDFDLSELEKWEKSLFIQAGNFWDMSIRDNKNSENSAYIGNLENHPNEFENHSKDIAFTYISFTSYGKIYQIVFNKKNIFSDCQ